MHLMTSKSAASGFTLVELLAAISILGLITVSTYSLIVNAVNSRAVSLGRGDIARSTFSDYLQLRNAFAFRNFSANRRDIGRGTGFEFAPGDEIALRMPGVGSLSYLTPASRSFVLSKDEVDAERDGVRVFTQVTDVNLFDEYNNRIPQWPPFTNAGRPVTQRITYPPTRVTLDIELTDGHKATVHINAQ